LKSEFIIHERIIMTISIQSFQVKIYILTPIYCCLKYWRQFFIVALVAIYRPNF